MNVVYILLKQYINIFINYVKVNIYKGFYKINIFINFTLKHESTTVK